MSIQSDYEFFYRITQGNEDAVDFLMSFFYACHLWDDLIDKDKERTDDHINNAFWTFIVTIPRNPWYIRNFHDLHPVIMNAIQEWMTANVLEKEDRQDIAYTLRCSIVSVVHQAALICGGYEWAVEINPEIRRYTQSETFDEYLEALKCQAPEQQ